MRTVTDTLRDAACTWGGRPVVSLDVLDQRPRWTPLLSVAGAGDMVAMLTVCNNYLLRARCGADGLSVALNYEPLANMASWVDWRPQHALNLPASDVAMAVVGARELSERVRIFCLGADGANARILVTESALGFRAPVTTASTVCSGRKPTGYLAAADECVFYLADGSELRVWRSAWGSGVWSERPNWGRGKVGKAYGVAAAYCDIDHLIHLVAAHDGRLLAGTYDVANDIWGPFEQIAPGGGASAGSPTSHRLPSLCYTAANRFLIGWVEALTVANLHIQPVVAECTRWPHVGNEVAVDIRGGASKGRPNLAWMASEGTALCADELSACARRLYMVGDPHTYTADLPVMAYSRASDTEGGVLEARIHNGDGAYDALGTAGAAEPIKPHAGVILRRGYRTSEGDETVALDPHYVVEASVVKGRDGGYVALRAVDGWGLLGCWRAFEPLTWKNKPLRWLLEEMCGRVGLLFQDDGTPAFGYPVPVYCVQPGESAARAVRQLLGLAGAVARYDAWGHMHALSVATLSAGQAAPVGQWGEILRASYGPRAVPATTFTVYGRHAEATEERVGDSMALGMRLRDVRVDERVTTAATCSSTLSLMKARATAAGRREELTMPVRPELELWDRVAVYGAGEALLEGSVRRVVGLRERYDPARGLLLSTLTLERGN